MLAGLLERRAAAGRSYERILYVGDGKGDFCPSLLLLHGSRHWHPAAALEAAAAAAPAAGGAQARAPAPCGAGGNRVFAREQYPDGLPCSLWVMLRTEARSGGSSSDAGGSGGAEGGSGPAAVVPWSSPEQLAALLTAELGLD